MPNIKSAKKRVLVIQKKSMENKMVLSAMRTAIKKLKADIAKGDKQTATAKLPSVFSEIDSAVSKGILHKNNAANKKAKLSKAIDKLESAKAE